jgi:putative membrane protein
MKINRWAKLLVAAAVASQMALWSYGADHSSATAQANANISKSDAKFINDAAEGGLMEVRMGEIGQQKGQSPDVKTLAQRLVTDHTKANDELKQLASSKGVTIPSQLPEHHQKMLDKLSNASDFDKSFKEAAVKDHKKDIKEFEKTLKKSNDTELKAWISKTLPTLQEHLRMAEQIGVTRTAKAK